GREGEQVPEMTDEIVEGISTRYIELFEQITGEKFQKTDTKQLEQRIEQNILNFLKSNN
nr:phosphoribosylaminoimidazolesuccinocarboxamide synthase [Paludibacteraceae bacterium]